MPRAKPIDRIELTRRKFGGGHGVVDRTQPRDGINHSREVLTASKSTPLNDEAGLKECPNCGAKSLKLDSGCMSCLSCGWSACG